VRCDPYTRAITIDVTASALRGAMSREVQLIHLVGESDLASRRELNEAVDAFRTSSAVHVERDLCDVTFFGSDGLHFLERLRSEAQLHGGTVTLVSPAANVTRVIDICGLADIRQEVGYARTVAPRMPSYPACGTPQLRTAPGCALEP
jgi:anti-anti-sigma factor